MQHNQMFDVKQVAKILAISVSGVWEKVRIQDDFPKPTKLSAKETRWSDTQIDAFIQGRFLLTHA